MSGEEPEDPNDPFNDLIEILSKIRADWEVKNLLLKRIAELVGAGPGGNLLKTVAECITNPDELKRMKESTKKVEEEAEVMRTELLALRENGAATREMANEAQKMVAEVKTILGEPGSAHLKARLYDEELHKEKKISGSRVMAIISDFEEQLKELLTKITEAADRMEASSAKLMEVPMRLSELSFPESFGLGTQGPGNRTPESSVKKTRGEPSEPTRINLDTPPSSEERPVPMEISGERNRNLSEVFEELGSPTIGSHISAPGVGSGQQ